MNKDNLIKPKKLQKGDTIGIVSPAGVIRKDLWDKAINTLNNKGYRVKIAPHANDKKDYLAGDDKSRLTDLMNFFEDDEVNTIICSRGGYGTMRLLDKIDYEIIKANPKIFVGYSDITALHSSILKKSGLVTFHGPLFLSDFGAENPEKYTLNNFFEVLENQKNESYNYKNPLKYNCIQKGKAKGELVGGNLAVLNSLLGTPFFPNMENKILMLEDVCEPNYKIDRMLTQLKLAGVFEKISGLLFGEFTCMPDNCEGNIINIISNTVNNKSIPIGIGFPSGHGKLKATLPFGVEYSFNSEAFELEIIEKYLS